MRYCINKFFILLFFLACTNPEVNFPDSEKKTEEKKTQANIFETPVVLLYENWNDLFYYYPFYRLASLNGAKDHFFIPSFTSQKAVSNALEKIQNVGKTKPVLLGLKIEKEQEWYSSFSEKIKKAFFPQKKEMESIEWANNFVEWLGNMKQPNQEKIENQKETENIKKSDSLSQWKEISFLIPLLEKMMEKKPDLTQWSEEKVFYLKGKTLPKASLSIFEKDGEKDILKNTYYSDSNGFFGPVIIRLSNPFFIELATKKIKRKYYFSGLVSSYPFCVFLPSEASIEIISFFSLLDINQLSLPEPIKMPEEWEKNKIELRKIYIFLGNNYKIDIQKDSLSLTIPEKILKNIKWKLKDREITLEPNISLFILD